MTRDTVLHESPTRSGNQSTADIRLERRSVLKLIGASAVPIVAGTASVSESDDGYGTGG